MATDTDTGRASGESGFGRVSRLRGRLFESLTLGASVFGIVALAVLLAYVFWDAFGLAAAEPGWYVVFAGLTLLPAVAFVWYARRHPVVGETSLELVSTALAGVLGGFGLVAVLEVIAGDEVWFTYFCTVVAP